MDNLKEQLIRIGNSHQDLRPHLRKILGFLEKVSFQDEIVYMVLDTYIYPILMTNGHLVATNVHTGEVLDSPSRELNLVGQDLMDGFDDHLTRDLNQELLDDDWDVFEDGSVATVASTRPLPDYAPLILDNVKKWNQPSSGFEGDWRVEVVDLERGLASVPRFLSDLRRDQHWEIEDEIQVGDDVHEVDQGTLEVHWDTDASIYVFFESSALRS